MASPGSQPPNPLELDITILSAKHLKNVNWRSGGDLRPYATIWVDPDRRISTRPDEFGSTKPVWNETFSLPVSSPESLLTVEIFHSKPADTPKPLVGTARVRLGDLAEPDEPDKIHSLQLVRPSGRPQGKVRVKIGLRERPPPPPPPPSASPATHPPLPVGSYQDYNFGPPQGGYYYSSAPPPPPAAPAPQVRDYRDYSPPTPYPAPPPPSAVPYYGATYSDAYPGYFPNYYSRPPPPRAFPNYGAPPPPSGPSAPVDSSGYEQRSGVGGGGVGTVTGTLGGLSLDERGKYDEERRAGGERAEESSVTSGVVRDNFSHYGGKY